MKPNVELSGHQWPARKDEDEQMLPAVVGPVERGVRALVNEGRGVGMQLLDELITAAMQLAGDDAVSHGARLWQSEGGRACPLGWGGCSQPVYVDVKTGAYDYGQPGGPGHADCVRNCKNGMQPCPEDDDE